MADPKLKAPTGEALSALAEAVGPQFVATQLHKKAAIHKSPKVAGNATHVCQKMLIPLTLLPSALSCPFGTTS